MTNSYFKKCAALLGCVLLTGFFGNTALFAQQTVMLKDLSAFKPNNGTWQMAGDVSGDPNQDNFLKVSKGEAIIVNLPTKKNNGQDLISIEEFGDIDLELEVMVATHSNSGVYLMGQYEIQVLDSWTKLTAKPGDMGGVYERWDDSKPEGQKGYEGYAQDQQYRYQGGGYPPQYYGHSYNPNMANAVAYPGYPPPYYQPMAHGGPPPPGQFPQYGGPPHNRDNFLSMVVVLPLIMATARSSHQALPIMGLGWMIQCLRLVHLILIFLLIRMNQVRIKTHLSEMHLTF